jgi:hypothetical protein
MSALLPKADIAERGWDVRFGPEADMPTRSFAGARTVVFTLSLARCQLIPGVTNA